ncbi:MAG: GNAT family protein [Pseudomonadota bacterium]
MPITCPIRPVGPGDLSFIAQAEADPTIAAFVSALPRQTHLENLASPDFGYRVGLDDQGRPVGYCVFVGLTNRHRSIELRNYAIARRRSGFGQAMLRALIAESFDELGANRLWLDVFPDNHVARQLYTKLGFREEGLMRECYIWKGNPQSSILMSILASEYRLSKGTS